MPEKVLEEVTTVRTELLAPKGRCQVCNHPDCAGIEAAIMNTAVTGDIAVGDKGLKDVANRYGVPLGAIINHRNSCMIRKMASELANSSQPSNRLAMESSATWINRLSYYLSKIDDQIERIEERGNDEGKWDEKLLLSAVDEARKICTSNAELFIKVYQLRVDKKVQDDFIKIVMEEVDRVSPELRDRIISRLTSRLALANAAGIS